MFASGRSRLITGTVLIFMVLNVLSCSGERADEKRGGILVVGEISDYEGLNPMRTTDAHARDVYNLLFLSLLDENDDFLTFTPRLAESYEFSEDRKKLTFHLRDDVWWSDGVKFTAEDVAATFSAQKDPETVWSGRHLKEHIDSVEVIDSETVVYHFNRIYPYQVMDANDGPILPAHVINSVKRSELGDIPAEKIPVSGPFIIESWERGQSLVLKGNDRYYEKGKPYLEKVIFKIIPDQVTLLTQLRDGEIDCMEAVPPSEMASIKQNNESLEIFDFPTRAYMYIAWNAKKKPFDNPRVRRALTMAIDRRLIIENLYYGYAEECTGPFVPLIWAFNPDIAPLPYDPEKASSILAEEGFHDADGDGYIEKNGATFEFELMANHGNQIRTDTQVMVQEMLRKVGVRVKPVLLEWTVMLQHHKACDFEAIINAWRVGTKADLEPIWGCDSRGKAGYNRVDYCNSTVDSLNHLASGMLDFDKARPLFYKAQQIIYDEQPYTFLYVPHTLFVLSKRFGGAKPDAIGVFHNLYEWHEKKR